MGSSTVAKGVKDPSDVPETSEFEEASAFNPPRDTLLEEDVAFAFLDSLFFDDESSSAFE